MDDLLSEKEQIEQIRSWWSEYGGYVIGGLGLGIALLAGLNYYTNSKLEAQLEASVLYESLTEHVVSGSLEAAEAVADELGTTMPRPAMPRRRSLPWLACTWTRIATRTRPTR